MKHPDWFRTIVEGASDFAIFSLDHEGRILTWNTGAERLFGFPPEEAIGQSGAVIFTPEDRVRDHHEFEVATAATEGRAEDTRWHLRRDGSRVWVSGLLMSIRDENNVIQGFVKIAQDKSDEKRMEESLRDSEEQFARLMLGNPAGIALERTDNGSFVLANERFLQLTGYWRAELMGRNGDSLSLWDNPSERERALREVRERGSCPSATITVRTKGRQVRRCVAAFRATLVSDTECIVGTYIPLGEDSGTG